MDPIQVLASIEYEEVPECPLCYGGTGDIVDMITDVDANRPSQSWKLCLSCGHAFVDPRPTEAFLSAYYTEGYRRQIYKLKDKESKEVMPAASVNEERNRAMKVATQIMLLKTKVSSHLDIGSSTGALCAGVVDFLRPAHSWGVEPGDAWRSFAEMAFAKRTKEMKLYEDDVKFVAKLSQVPKSPKFELVTIIHTLEHLREPRAVIEEAKRRMKIDGLLVVEVPNRYGGHPNPLMWPHLHSFTEQTIDRLLTEVGFYPILHDTFGNFPPFFPPPQAILVAATLRPPEISLANVLSRFNMYRALIGDVQKRMAQARPSYEIG